MQTSINKNTVFKKREAVASLYHCANFFLTSGKQWLTKNNLILCIANFSSLNHKLNEMFTRHTIIFSFVVFHRDC